MNALFPEGLFPAGLFPAGLEPGGLLLLVLAAFCAGWIDAAVGGGGLVQLPALLLVPGIGPVQALATNKLSSLAGTTASSLSYLRRTQPDLGTALPMAAVALPSAAAGAALAARLPTEVFKPVILLALVAVAVVTIARPSLGRETRLRFRGAPHLLLALLLGGAIGFYDGLLGPGTGTFLIIGLAGLLGYDFLLAGAKAKIVNLATNLGALLFFAPHGAVLWGLGAVMGAASVLGGLLGSRVAIAGGQRFLRIALLVVVTALVLRLGADLWREAGGG